jgi:hypothetical protein
VCREGTLAVDLGRTRVSIPEKSSRYQGHRGFVKTKNQDLVILEIPRRNPIR